MTRAIESGPAATDDADLLKRFAAAHNEEAFAALVDRHGPMVLGICRRILRNSTDADDAFQATFLLLAMRAGRIREPSLLGNWLFGVATRTALGARRAAARRIVQEKRLMRFLSSRRPATTDDADLQMTLDEQIAKLPDKLRRVIICCHLQGLTKRETAKHLKWPESTVTARLKQARVLLKERLSGKGLSISDQSISAVLAPAVVPAVLHTATVKAGAVIATGKIGAAGIVSAKAVTLAKGTGKAMFLAKVKLAAVIVVLVSTLGVVGTATVKRSRADLEAAIPARPFTTSAPSATSASADRPEGALGNGRALNALRQATISIQIYGSRHHSRLPPDLKTANVTDPFLYLANGEVRTSVLKNSYAIVVVAEVPRAGYDGPIGIGFLDGHSILVSQAEAQERIDECRRFFETARTASEANPADGAMLGGLDAPILSVQLPASRAILPADLRAALSDNAAALEPLAIAWNRTGSSPLGERDATETLYVDPFFFKAGAQRTVWSSGKIYTWNNYVRGSPYESTIAGGMTTYIGSGPHPYVSKQLVSVMRNGDMLFQCEYLERAGLHLPGTRSELEAARANSVILRQVEDGAAVMAVEDVNVDGRASKRVSLQAANPDHRWLHRLPDTRDYVYYLDPQMGYAVWREEERYGARIVSRTENDRFERLGTRMTWLPRRSVKNIYTVRLLPERFFENPVLTETLELTEMSGLPVPAERFVLKPPLGAAKVVTAAKPITPTSMAVGAEPRLATDDVLAGVPAAAETTSQWWVVTATISGIVALLAMLALWKYRKSNPS